MKSTSSNWRRRVALALAVGAVGLLAAARRFGRWGRSEGMGGRRCDPPLAAAFGLRMVEGRRFGRLGRSEGMGHCHEWADGQPSGISADRIDR